jgi:hypothetical protein
MKYLWKNKRILGSRYDQPCQVLCRTPSGANVKVVFADGYMLWTTKSSVRKKPEPKK